MKIKIYLKDITSLRGRLSEILPLLTEQRREKALRLKNEDDRLRSAAAGLILNKIFGNDFVIAEGERGKPLVVGSQTQISISHSGNFAAVAVADVPVGLDIQQIRPFPETLKNRLFTAEELSGADNDTALTALWTEKEAFAKLDGESILQAVGKKTDSSVIFRTSVIEDTVLAVAARTEFEAEIIMQ